MKEIIYKFQDGAKQVVKVEDDIYEQYKNLETEDKRVARRESRRHTSLNYLNEQGIDFEDESGNLEKNLLNDEFKNQLQNAISLLNEKQQDLIQQVFYKNKTLSDIAKEKGISKSAITQQMQVIYKKMKEILKNF